MITNTAHKESKELKELKELKEEGIDVFKNRLSTALRSVPTGDEHENLREGIELCLLNIKTGASKGVVYASLIEAATIFTHYMVIQPDQEWQVQVARAFAGDEAI